MYCRETIVLQSRFYPSLVQLDACADVFNVTPSFVTSYRRHAAGDLLSGKHGSGDRRGREHRSGHVGGARRHRQLRLHTDGQRHTGGRAARVGTHRTEYGHVHGGGQRAEQGEMFVHDHRQRYNNTPLAGLRSEH